MAIDDNTLYGLTGAQIKELPGKIEAVKGKARVLTTTDYNYPTDNPNCIGLWLLDNGLYYAPAGVETKANTNSSISSADDKLFVIGKGSNYAKIYPYRINNARSNSISVYTTILSSGAALGNPVSILDSSDVANNLTSYDQDHPLSANQGRILKNLVDSLAIRAAGAPTTATVGQVGTLYEDTTNGDLYICTDATNPYVWEAVGGGGGGPTVVQTTGTSTTDVMSQNAVTSMIFADPATMQKIKIGAGASTSEGTNAIEIGYNSTATAPNGIALGSGAGAGSTNGATAIGANSTATGIGSIALGGGWQGAVASGIGAINIGGGGTTRPVTGQGAISLGIFAPANSDQGKIEVGSTNTSYGYNSSNYRLLTGLYDGQSDHDAATVGQLKMGVLSATPTGTTAGFPGRLYTYDTTGSGDYEVWLCVHDNGDNTYVWKQVSLT